MMPRREGDGWTRWARCAYKVSVRRRARRARSSFRLDRWVGGARELPALGLALLWLLGVVVAPIVHLGLHGSLAPHEHGSTRENALETHVAACHDGHCHGEVIDHDHGADEAPADHGRGSPLHGDLAALFPAPPFVIPPFVAIGERAVPDALADVVEAPAPPSALARGPPLAA
jgi:hypothetical protein